MWRALITGRECHFKSMLTSAPIILISPVKWWWLPFCSKRLINRQNIQQNLQYYKKTWTTTHIAEIANGIQPWCKKFMTMRSLKKLKLENWNAVQRKKIDRTKAMPKKERQVLPLCLCSGFICCDCSVTLFWFQHIKQGAYPTRSKKKR